MRLFDKGAVSYRNGTFVAKAEYALQVIQRVIDARTKQSSETMSGTKRIIGRITGLNTPAFLFDDAVLTLHLSDGRLLDFRFTDPDGTISALSGIYESCKV